MRCQIAMIVALMLTGCGAGEPPAAQCTVATLTDKVAAFGASASSLATRALDSGDPAKVAAYAAYSERIKLRVDAAQSKLADKPQAPETLQPLCAEYDALKAIADETAAKL
jgi:hypothetical protein